MNRQIVQLFGLFAVLFALLVGFTSRWTVFEAQSLEDNQNNRRPLIEEQQIPRGLILASDGRTVLARSAAAGPRRGPHLHAHLSAGAALLAPGRLLVHPQRPGGPRAVAQRRPGRRGGRVRVDLLRPQGRDREGLDVVTNLDVAGTRPRVAGAGRGARARSSRSSRRPARSG